MPIISVIVPVYNVEKYVGRCIESILVQTFTDFELILVDDGATDNSGKICDQYAEKDDRIRVIHKENGGVSAARNSGIDYSSGEYIMFVDSDDYIDKPMLEDMIRYSGSDMIISGLKYIDINGNEMSNRIEIAFENITISDFFNKYYIDLDSKCILSGPYNRFYKKCIIDKYNIRFNVNMSIFEDGLFVTEFLCRCDRISNISKSYYNYVQYNNGNLMTKYNDNAIEASLIFYNTEKALLKKLGTDQDGIKKYIDEKEISSIANCISHIYSRSKLKTSEKYKKLKSELSRPEVMGLFGEYAGSNRKVKLIGIAVKYRGVFLLHLLLLVNWSEFIRMIIKRKGKKQNDFGSSSGI